MKILHAAETIKGGVATVIKQLAYSQINDGDNNKVICLIPDNQCSELNNISKNNIVTFKRKGRDLISLLRFFLKFTVLIIKERPDLIHLHSTFSGALGRISLIFLKPFLKSKVIYCPHAFSFLMEGSKIKRKMFFYVEKILLPITDNVICVSQYEKKMAVELGLSKKKLVVIYNGVPAKLTNMKKKVSKPLKLLFVGRFDHQKGYDLLIETIVKLNKNDFVLTIIGDSVNSKNQRIEAENIVYTGWIDSDSMEPYFLNADVLIIPSRWEGFAMVPLEAMSYSLPIIASDSTSLPEVVLDKITGLLFEKDNADSLLRCILQLSDYDLISMGKEGNKYFINKFTDKKMIASTSHLYSKALGQ